MTFGSGGEPRLEETKRIGRVLAIVRYIADEPRRWTRARLAEGFEMSERMIDNDLQLIRNGLKYELRHTREGYYFGHGPLLRPLHLTVPEVLALVLAAQAARDAGNVDPATIAATLGKLEAALPGEIVPYLRRAAAERAGAVVLPAEDRSPTLALLERALLEGRAVRVVYASASRGGTRSERTICPYRLLQYERSWQVIAHDSLSGEVRMFKIDRIEQADLTDERYAVPEDFDLASYFGATWGVLRSERAEAEAVVLRFTPQGAAWVRDDVWHSSQEMETLPDGGIVLRFFCTVTHEMVRWVLGFGCEVVVEEPERLKREVMAEAKRVVDGASGL